MKKPAIVEFSGQREWRSWLEKNQAVSDGVWLRIYKKDSHVKSVSYAEALDEALCQGWIDSQKKSHDRASYLQKFTPRRPRSIWSKVNIAHVKRLTKAGKMRAAGRRQVEGAKKDGRWDRAYDSARTAAVPEDFLKALRRNPKAAKFFRTLNKTNLYSITWRLQTAKKPETRKRRIRLILEMLAKSLRFHE